jgi:hypothetical protein
VASAEYEKFSAHFWHRAGGTGEGERMSTSTNGMLVYGYIWSEDVNILEAAHTGEDDQREWPEIIADRRGIANPWDGYPSPSGVSQSQREAATRRAEQWIATHRAEIDARREAIKAIEAEFGVVIDSHGSDSWTCPIVSIAGASITAHRGYPKQITPANLEVGADWDAKLATFIAELGIDTSEAEGPGWFLASWWG